MLLQLAEGDIGQLTYKELAAPDVRFGAEELTAAQR